ncbi:MAG: 2-phospho-L-lactate guanylyltransferase [Acidobacteriota bacterium]
MLPVKAFSQAKSRLSALLSGMERRQLLWAFFLDAAQALRGCRKADCIAVVSSEARVLERARKEGWIALEEPSQKSESHSVDQACAALSRQGFEAVLRLPTDIPSLRSRDIDLILEADCPASAILVPSQDGLGTNALMRNPPDAFPSHFGPGSLRLHLRAADQAGLFACVVENHRLALDLDTPEDVLAFLQRPTDGHTLRALQEMRMEERLLGRISHGLP